MWEVWMLMANISFVKIEKVEWGKRKEWRERPEVEKGENWRGVAIIILLN
jgi:hypothetical protein